VFQSVEQFNSSSENQKDMEIIPIDNIQEIRRTKSNGIEFLSFPAESLLPSSSIQDNTGLILEVSTKHAVATTLEDSLHTPSPPKMTNKTTTNSATVSAPPLVKTVLAEIVLSSYEDRETLFWGLNTCLSFLKDKQEKEKNNIMENTLSSLVHSWNVIDSDSIFRSACRINVENDDNCVPSDVGIENQHQESDHQNDSKDDDNETMQEVKQVIGDDYEDDGHAEVDLVDNSDHDDDDDDDDDENKGINISVENRVI
jgi:hypothetical protein